MSVLADTLNGIGLPAADVAGGLVKIPGYRVCLGRHRGECVDVAVQGADFPVTPPAGVHVRAVWGADRPNVNPSPLGPEWRYFSRTLPGWKGRNLIHVLLAYINRVLGDA